MTDFEAAFPSLWAYALTDLGYNFPSNLEELNEWIDWLAEDIWQSVLDFF